MNYRLVLVGEAPGAESIRERPSLALTGSSGRNLCSIAGWEWMDYLRFTERMNLFLDPQPSWDERAACDSASEMVELFRARRVILLGAKVAKAFGRYGAPSYAWMDVDAERRGWASCALVPHPSGRNRLWNSEEERARAREFLGGLIP